MPDEKPAELGFEAALTQLERTVERLESGELSLEETLQLFERGVELRDRCQKELLDAETRIEMLVRRASGVQPEPFDPETNS